MDDLTLILIVCAVIFFLLIKGVVKTFKRQPVVAILCFIFLFPIFAIWAFIELFTGSINKGANALFGESDYETETTKDRMELMEIEALTKELAELEAENKELAELEAAHIEAENKGLAELEAAQINRELLKEDKTAGFCEFTQKDIQKVLDIFITGGYAVNGPFHFVLSERENIYAQGFLVSDNTCRLEISGKDYLTNPYILDIYKFKKLVSLGWKIPDEEGNFNSEVTVKDVLEDKVAELLFESLKVFDLPDSKIDCTYDLVFAEV